jgi:hypothetical protein
LLLVPQTAITRSAPLLVLGAALATFMAAFDLAIGHFLMRRPWAKTFQDLDPRTGNLLLFGLAFLVVAPWLVGWLRGG